MPVQNTEIAGMLEKLADLLEIEGANPFRIRAYRNAAQTINGLTESVASMIKQDRDLTTLPGVGDALAIKLKEMVTTGHLAALEKEEKRIPESLTDLLHIPGLGPKRVHTIFETLAISTRDDLHAAIDDGRLGALPGFGPKTVAHVLRHLEEHTTEDVRIQLARVMQIAEPLIAYLAETPDVETVTPAGSLRRGRETVGDLDILVIAGTSTAVMDRFVHYEDVEQVLSQGDTRSSVLLRGGFQVDLRVVPAASYGAALHYFTGSKDHNVAVRAMAQKAGLKINEYGVFKGDKQIGGKDELDIFEAVGLPFIEPELRENRGEFDAAHCGTLPALIQLENMQGDLHCHTNASDGRASLEEMAHAAQERGYTYLAVSDHSKRLTIAHGLNATRLMQQIRDIDTLNASLKNFRILKSVEVDILEDGSLDLDDSILAQLDVVVGSIHYKFGLSRERQTERIIRAMENPYFDILGHPTGRLINEREPYEIDMEAILAAASEYGCALELNAQPSRLDLTDVHCRMARERGVKVSISTDAHTQEGLSLMRFGIAQARRGWLEPDNVLNTRPWPELRSLLRARDRK